jgi:hypothetical protein
MWLRRPAAPAGIIALCLVRRLLRPFSRNLI